MANIGFLEHTLKFRSNIENEKYFPILDTTLSEYQIFFELMDTYPTYISLIAEIMRYKLVHQNSFEQATYLNGTFNEDDVRFIFEKLNLSISSVIKSTHRTMPHTIVNLNLNE